MANCIQYAQWNALFFAVKSGDQETVDFLMQNNAEAGIKDEASACFATSLIISYMCVCVCVQNGHTPLSYSKGLILQRKVQMYKHLVRKQEESARAAAVSL